MSTFPTTILDILRTLAQPLHIASLFPATVWMLLNTYLIIPMFDQELTISPWWLVISFTLIVIVSYFLYVLNGPLTRFAEGYTLEWTPFGERWKKKWRNRYDAILNEIVQCEEKRRFLTEISNIYIRQHPELNEKQLSEDPDFREIRFKRDQWEARKRTLENRKQLEFPPHPTEIVPTGLGNIIAAFEGYAWDRYRMDAIYLWPRLTPILQEDGYSDFVSQEKTAFDFFLNLAAVAVLIGAELTFVYMLSLQWFPAIVAFAAGIVAAYVFYRSAHTAAIHWGGRMKSAFDLYREPLREKLHIRKPFSFDDERNLWHKLSDFYRSANTRFDDFDYYRESLPIIISDRTGIEVSKVTVDDRRTRTRFALIVKNTREATPVDEVRIVDFVESDFAPTDVTISDPATTWSHQRIDEWANASEWKLGTIAGGATVILTYSLAPQKTTSGEVIVLSRQAATNSG
jgi:hypothetical protein